jgi:hypothetical protein
MSRTKNVLKLVMLITSIGLLGGLNMAWGYAVPSPAETTIVNGIWDGSTAADAPGELSIQVANVINGIDTDSLRAADSIVVDTGFAFSSLESLLVPSHSSKRAQDSVCIRYIFQNYGNYASDSFEVYVNITDTASIGHFVPNYFRIVGSDSNTTRGAAVSLDTAKVRLALAPAAFDTFIVKMRIPKPDSAQDQDTIRIAVRVKDRHCLGTDDSWPNTTIRAVFDTANQFMHVHESADSSDTLWDYGDTQRDTVFVAIGGPILRLAKRVNAMDGTKRPGDRLIYSIYYDNDGSASSVDTSFIVDYLPTGVAFLDTVTTDAGNGATIKTYLRHGSDWLDHIPSTATPLGQDSLLRISAVRFAIPPGINPQAGTVADSALQLVADDSTGTDAGLIKFRVRIR